MGWCKDHEMDAVPISATEGVCQLPMRAYTNVNSVAHRSGCVRRSFTVTTSDPA
jgi:hypothetical protein